MRTKGVRALRAQRQVDDSCAEALRRIEAAGFALPDMWGKREGTAVIVEFSGCPSLQLRTDVGDFGTWSLWFAGARVGLFRSARDALAEAKARGFLVPAKERTSL